MNKILWILPNLCFPPSDGGKQALYYKILKISEYVESHVIIAGGEKDSKYETERSYLDLKKIVKSINVIKNYGTTFTTEKNLLKKTIIILKWIFSKKPKSAQPYESMKVKNFVTDYVLNNNIDSIVFDDSFTSEIIDIEKLKLNDIKIICVMHNIETLYFASTSNASAIFGRSSFLLKREKNKFYSYEKKVYSSVDLVIGISSWDVEYIRKHFKQVEAKYLPCLLPEKTVQYNLLNDSDYIVFPGSLMFYPNYHGVMWFVEKIFNKYRQSFPYMKFMITGNLNSEINDKFKKHSGIILTGYLSECQYQDLVLNARFCIAPIIKGAGVKIKILDTISYGLPLITLISSAQGIPLENVEANKMPFMLAENEDEFLACMIKMTNSIEIRQEFSKNALCFFDNNYNMNKNVFKWMEYLS